MSDIRLSVDHPLDITHFTKVGWPLTDSQASYREKILSYGNKPTYVLNVTINIPNEPDADIGRTISKHIDAYQKKTGRKVL